VGLIELLAVLVFALVIAVPVAYGIGRTQGVALGEARGHEWVNSAHDRANACWERTCVSRGVAHYEPAYDHNEVRARFVWNVGEEKRQQLQLEGDKAVELARISKWFEDARTKLSRVTASFSESTSVAQIDERRAKLAGPYGWCSDLQADILSLHDAAKPHAYATLEILRAAISECWAHNLLRLGQQPAAPRGYE
jgi:hypothetical protein